MRLTTRELKPDLWPQLKELFGSNGACGGCWCMSWRLKKGERWDDIKGSRARDRFRRLVKADRAHGILAFAGPQAVGWCAMGPRLDFHRLQRARTLRCDDPEDVWSLPCFFVKRDYRHQGVAGLMLRAALKALDKRGVRIAEGYPVKPPRDAGTISPAFAWTGTRSLFADAGFEVVGNKDGAKQRVRKILS